MIQEKAMYYKMLSKIVYATLFVSVLSGWGTAYSQEQFELTAMFPEANAMSIYKLDFTLADTLKADGQLKITFPEAFDLSKVKMAGSSTINGGFTVKVADSTVLVSRSGIGNVVLPGTPVDVKFANIKNPPDYMKSYSAKIEILNQKIKFVEKAIAVKIVAEEAK